MHVDGGAWNEPSRYAQTENTSLNGVGSGEKGFSLNTWFPRDQRRLRALLTMPLEPSNQKKTEKQRNAITIVGLFPLRRALQAEQRDEQYSLKPTRNCFEFPNSFDLYERTNANLTFAKPALERL